MGEALLAAQHQVNFRQSELQTQNLQAEVQQGFGVSQKEQQYLTAMIIFYIHPPNTPIKHTYQHTIHTIIQG